MQRLWQGLKATRRLLLASAAAAGPALTWPADTRVRTVMVGDTALQLLHWRSGPCGLRWINLHEDEQTSVQAAWHLLAGQAGELIGLRAQGHRLVRARLGWRPIVFDPNRIFTDAGLQATLRRHASDTAAARAAVTGLRDAVLQALQRPDAGTAAPIVALHNNRGGAYDVHAYLPGGAHAADAQAVAVAPAGQGQVAQDFFLVTRRAHFEALRDAGFNTVLQSESPIDDGSLSVYCHRLGLAYVNVEAGACRLAAQVAMLRAVAALA